MKGAGSIKDISMFGRSAPRFDVADPAALAHLEEKGFAALPQVRHRKTTCARLCSNTVQPSAASKCIRSQAVFGNVLDKEEVQVATDLFWKYMELSTNSVRRDNPLTLLGV